MTFQQTSKYYKQDINIPRNYSFEFLFILFAAIFSLFISIIIALFYTREYGYEFIYLLPLLFSFIILFFRNVFLVSFKSIGLAIFNGIEFLRYVITPFFMVIAGFYNSTFYAQPTYEGKKIAIYLMLYELIAEYLLANLLLRKFKISYIKKENYVNTDFEKYHWLYLISSIILIALAIFTNFHHNSYRIHLFSLSNNYTNSNYILGELSLECSTILLYIFFSIPILLKYIKTKNVINCFIFLIISLFFTGINFGDVRMFFIIKSLIVIAIIFRYINNKSKYLLIILIILCAFLSIYIMTLSDNNAFHGLFYFTGTNHDKQTYAYTIQTYFSGPYNYAKTIDIYNNNLTPYNVSGIQLFINDILKNTFPFSLLNIDSHNTTKVIFNHYLYGNYDISSQIIPLAGQGLLYFGYILSPLLTLILLTLLILFETLSLNNKNNNPYIIFISNSLSIYLGCMHMYNISIISGIILNIFIPTFLIVLYQEYTTRSNKLNENFICNTYINKRRSRKSSSFFIK